MTHAMTMISEDPHKTHLLGCVTLGLVFTWVAFGWSALPIYGSESFAPPSYYTGRRLAVGLTFLALSLPRLALGLAVRPLATGIGALLAVASVIIVWLDIPGVFAGAAIAAGIAQGLLMASWLARFRSDLPSMLFMLVGAQGIGGLLHLSSDFFGGAAGWVLSIVCPLASLVLMICMPRGKDPDQSPNDQPAANDSEKMPASFLLLGGCLLTLNFANRLASADAMIDSGGGVYLEAVVTLAGALALALLGMPRPETLLICLTLASCCFMGTMLALPNVPAPLYDCLFVSTWVILLYGLAWFAQLNRGTSPTMSGTLRGWSAVFLAAALANVVASFVPGQTGRVLSLLITVLTLSVAFIGTVRHDTVRNPQSSAPTIRSDEPVTSRGVVASLAAQCAMTTAEQSVFELLAQGNSLRSIAAQLQISESTAKYHRHNVYQKLGITSRQELIDLVQSRGES